MIPWRRVSKDTLPELKQHYENFEPYCHFNIVDMWSYRVGPNYWFKVGDSVVYKLNNYMDDTEYLTILGAKNTKDALKELCRKSPRSKKIILRSVPEVSLRNMHGWGAIESHMEDEDYHDYIFDAQSLANLSSPLLDGKRKLIEKLLQEHSIKVLPLNHRLNKDRQRIYGMFHRWVRQTGSTDWKKELLALRRALNMNVDLVCLAFTEGRKIIGYTVNGPEKSGYYQAYFGKADRRYRGLSVFQEVETARYISKKYGSRYMNLQPDCGLEGLREYKKSLGPSKMLRKYVLTLDAKKARSS